MVAGMNKVLAMSMDWDSAKSRLALEQQTIQDIAAPLSEWEADFEGNRFGLRRKSTSRFYAATPWAMKQLARVGKCREFDWMLEDARHPTSVDKMTGEKKVLFARDQRDADLVKQYVNTQVFQGDRVDQDKQRLFRTWEDGTLRSVLSQHYQPVNNSWYMNTIQSMFPDSKIIRWRGNADTLQFDVHLPGIEVEGNDSGYGGILRIGNSEIGQKSVIAQLGVLRFICTNGMIVIDAIAGIRQRHMGDIDLIDLRSRVIDTVAQGLPNIEDEIQRTLGLKAYGVGDVPLSRIFAQLGMDYKIGKKHLAGVWGSWMTESEIVGPEVAQTAFGLQAAVTRFGQTLGNDGAHSFDLIGGELNQTDRPTWDRFLGRASNMTDEMAKSRVGDAALVA